MVETLSTSTRSADYGSGDLDARAMMGSITNAAFFAEQTYAVACSDMIGIFTSCTKNVAGFTSLGLRQQASCYCCQGSGSSETWTDAMGEYASTCADWASTGEPLTAYSVAKTFATFCEDYTDVCDGGSPSTSDSYYTTDSGFTTATDASQDIVTITGNGDNPATTTSHTGGGGSKGLSTGAIAGIAAGVGVVALLALAGLALFFLKKKKPAATPPPGAPPAMTQQNQPPQQPYNGQQQQPIGAAAGFVPYNNQQQQQQQQQGLYNNGHQSPPPDMQQQQQYNNMHPDAKLYGSTSPVSYQPSPSPQQTIPTPYQQTPSPYQANAAPVAWAPAGQQQQSPVQSMAAVPPPANNNNQMHFAAELPTSEMANSHLPTFAQELPAEDRTRYSELPSGAPTPQPQHGQPHH